MDALTLEKAYETAYGTEAANRRAGELQASKVSGGTVNQVVRDKAGVDKKPFKGSSSCSRCGKTNHSPDACYYRWHVGWSHCQNVQVRWEASRNADWLRGTRIRVH